MKNVIALVLMLFIANLCHCHERPTDKFTVNKLFSSHMVLQRGKPIRVFGTAKPGDSVTVSLAGKKVTTTTDASGDWLAEFPAMKAGTGYSLEITGPAQKGKLVFSDVAIGEVWLCSGQSNMGISVWSKNPNLCAANPEEEVKNANWPLIREFRVPMLLSPGEEKKDFTQTSWKVCNPENVKPFSALGYFFARQLYKDLKAPIGVIHSSWGGTNIKAWMPREAFTPAGETRALDDIANAVKTLGGMEPKEFARERDKEINAWVKKFVDVGREARKASETWKNPDFDDSEWTSWTGEQTTSEHALRVVWYRNTINNIPASYAGKETRLAIPSFVGASEVYLNGKLVGKTDALKPIDRMWTSRSFNVPAGIVVPGKNVVVIRLCYYGSGITKFNKNYSRISCGGSGRPLSPKKWKTKTEYTVDTAKIGKCPPLYDKIITSPNFAGALFNSMIAPLTRYPVRGFLWYQGEADTYSPPRYYPKQRELINSWRKRWKEPELPFILVQLAGFWRHCPHKRLPDNFWKTLKPSTDNWIALREVQGEIGKLPYVGLITAMDVGDHSDVHPRDKQTLGFRAAKEAERLAYGQNIVSRGPTYRGMKIEGDKIRIYFDELGGGLVTKDEKTPHAFSIAGKDGKYVWADAIIDGDTVIVSSPKATKPANVRYAWARFRPDLNLQNKEGFPAFPFRTDAPEYK